jgi:hypothetical protein
MFSVNLKTGFDQTHDPKKYPVEYLSPTDDSKNL